MNILWIYNHPLNPEAGGTERITSLIAKGLSLHGHQCIGMLVFDESIKHMFYKGNKIDNLFCFLKEQNVDIVINQIAYAKWLLNFFLKNGGNKWKKEGGRIISCLHFDPKNPSLLYYYKSKQNKSLIDILNILKTFFLYKYYEKRQQENEGDIYNYIYENSDWFVTLSETHFPYLKKVMKRDKYDKLVAINNPLTFDDISVPDILSQKKKIVLVCARMSEYHKRISIVLKTWRYLQKFHNVTDWTLVLLGDGPDIQRYKHFVKKHKLHNIKFEGQQSPEPYYREASILLLTSSAEGWGLAITEGLQRGVVPVVMNSCPVFSEIIQNGQNGFIVPNNKIKLFAHTVLQLMTHHDYLHNTQCKALKSAERFCLDATMEKWIKIINPTAE